MKLPAIFSDHAVLQRNRPVPIWGWSQPGDTVTVEFAGQKKSAVADANGKWLLRLDPLPASTEPRTLTARVGQTPPITVRDLLVGDVWLCSGQSNMEWPLSSSSTGAATVVAATHPNLRLLTVPHVALIEPQTDIDSAWKTCTPDNAANFSAVGYYFGHELLQNLNIPIGLIDCAWGGTRIETWTSRDALMAEPIARQEVEKFEVWKQSPEGQVALKNFAAKSWDELQGVPDPGNTGYAKGWAAPEFNDADWPTMLVPSQWQTQGHEFSGAFWFRREVNVPAAWAGQDLVLHLGACDKVDTTYFNNTQVGAIGFDTKNSWCMPRVYTIPGRLVRVGRNVIATRVFSNIYHGGMIGLIEQIRLAGPDSAVPLDGPWRYQIEHNLGLVQPSGPPPGPGNPNTLHILYDSMITPLVPAALAGAIWYQGESNAAQPRRYRQLFPIMIRDWRRTFQHETLPFYFVQLANYMPAQMQPVESGWAELREAQTLALREPHTGMAVIIDIGEANDIHPKNKHDVGHRLAVSALAQTYGRPVVASGPLYRSHRIEGDTIRIEFDHVADGLRAEGALKGFAVAGADRHFVWAEAHIDGNAVVVSGTKPVAVRYSWANNPRGNLYNSAGLPASSFRTDMD